MNYKCLRKIEYKLPKKPLEMYILLASVSKCREENVVGQTRRPELPTEHRQRIINQFNLRFTLEMLSIFWLYLTGYAVTV